jgi:hypothetical protein
MDRTVSRESVMEIHHRTREPMIDDFDLQSWTLTFIERTSELIVQDYQMWLNICKLLLTALADIDIRRLPKSSIVPSIHRLDSPSSPISIVIISISFK